jgi:peptidoglycan/xylan/chitin deacetylase (PgdA/CDA1 family)
MLKTCFDAAIIIPISIMIILSLLLYVLAQDDMQLALANQTTTMMKNQVHDNSIRASSSSTTNTTNTTNKVVILNFYDDDISQFTNAKPKLDKYGFKVTFFIVCDWANSDNKSRMTWQEINQLYREGHDIESHSMTHKRLNKLSENTWIMK